MMKKPIKALVTVTPGIASAKVDDFLFKEFETIEEQVGWALREYAALERNVVIAIGVTWGWLFLHKRGVPPGAWFVPVLFGVLGILRALGHRSTFKGYDEYVMKIEEAFKTIGYPQGWEHDSWVRRWASPSAYAFWGVLFVATVFVAVWGSSS
jgi:hypothetical protein